MVLRGNPTAKPLAVDTNHRLSPFLEHIVLEVSHHYFSGIKSRGVGVGGGKEGCVPEASLKLSKNGGFEHFTVHIFAYRLM